MIHSVWNLRLYFFEMVSKWVNPPMKIQFCTLVYMPQLVYIAEDNLDSQMIGAKRNRFLTKMNRANVLLDYFVNGAAGSEVFHAWWRVEHLLVTRLLDFIFFTPFETIILNEIWLNFNPRHQNLMFNKHCLSSSISNFSAKGPFK